MFKKITSNRDPRDTVFSEIRKEFRPWFDRSGGALRSLAENYPRFLFIMMVVNLVMSAILVMTVFRQQDEPAKPGPAVNVTAPVGGGFDRIMEAGIALRQTIQLKREIDSLSGLKVLSKADSSVLLKDLDSLRHISLPINPNNHAH